MRKTNNKHQKTRSLKEAPFNEEPMRMQEGSRKEYAPMMEEDMDAFEGFGGEVPIYNVEEEEGLGYYDEGEMGTIDTMGDFGDATFYEGAFDENLSLEDFEGGEDTMPTYQYDETMDEGVIFTQEDIDRMVDSEQGMDPYYMAEEPYYDEMDMDQYAYENSDINAAEGDIMGMEDTIAMDMENEDYEYMLEEQQMFDEMGLEKEADYQAVMIEEKYGNEFNDMNGEEISDEEAYENMLEEQERYAEMGLEEEMNVEMGLEEEYEFMLEEEQKYAEMGLEEEEKNLLN